MPLICGEKDDTRGRPPLACGHGRDESNASRHGRSIEYDAVTCKEHEEHPSAPPTAVADARPLAGLMYSERGATPPTTRVVAHEHRVLVPVNNALDQRSVKREARGEGEGSDRSERRKMHGCQYGDSV
jgi:hypothetical protein